MPAKYPRLDVLDERWRARHRRMWKFLVLAPYAIMLPFVLLIPLRTHLPRAVVATLALVGVLMVAVYLVVGLVAVWRVYAEAYRTVRR